MEKTDLTADLTQSINYHIASSILIIPLFDAKSFFAFSSLRPVRFCLFDALRVPR